MLFSSPGRKLLFLCIVSLLALSGVLVVKQSLADSPDPPPTKIVEIVPAHLNPIVGGEHATGRLKFQFYDWDGVTKENTPPGTLATWHVEVHKDGGTADVGGVQLTESGTDAAPDYGTNTYCDYTADINGDWTKGVYHCGFTLMGSNQAWAPAEPQEYWVNITVQDVLVRFSKDEVRPGNDNIAHSASRAEDVSAQAFRSASLASNGDLTITVTSDNARASIGTPAPTLTITGGNTSSNPLNITVHGLATSGAPQDTHLLAKLADTTQVGSLPVTIVTPGKFTNTAAKSQSVSPPLAVWDTLAATPQYGLQWEMHVDFTIQDQFGTPLHPQWNGIYLQERKNNGPWVGLSGASDATLVQNDTATDVVMRYYTNTPAWNAQQATQAAQGHPMINAGGVPNTLDARYDHQIRDGQQYYSLTPSYNRATKIVNNVFTVSDPL